jgi:hypothetical protein
MSLPSWMIYDSVPDLRSVSLAGQRLSGFMIYYFLIQSLVPMRRESAEGKAGDVM